MLHECMVTTNQLSEAQIGVIHYSLKHPLSADFGKLSHIHGRSRKLLDWACSLQDECRAILDAVHAGAAPAAPLSSIELSGGLRLDGWFGQRRRHGAVAGIPEKIAVEMLLEDFHNQKLPIDALDKSQLSVFIALYWTVHALILVECGVCEVRQAGWRLSIRKTAAFSRALHTTWFCSAMNKLSKVADMRAGRELLRAAREQGMPILEWLQRRPAVLDLLATSHVDKVLSLHADYLHRLPDAARPVVESVLERARLIALIDLVWLDAFERSPDALDDPPRMRLTPAALSALRIPVAVLHELLDLSAGKPRHDRLLHVDADDHYRAGSLSLQQNLIQYCAPVLKPVGSLLGSWFETDYVHSYIDKNVPPSRYRAYPGGKSKSKAGTAYDVDLIIEDVEADRLLLCQVKYRTESQLPFARTDWTEFFLGETVQKAVRQLGGLADAFDDERVVNLIRTRTRRRDIDSAYLKNRCSLTFIHNIDGYAFCRYRGVNFYDWTSLRNLLRRRIVQVGPDQAETMRTYAERVPLEDVEATIAFMKRNVLAHPDAPDLDREWQLFGRSYLEIRRMGQPRKGLLTEWLRPASMLDFPMT